MVIASVVLGLISTVFFYLIINYIKLNDKEIKVKKEEYILILFIYMICVYTFIKIYGISIMLAFRYLVLNYLVITAFIDLKTKYVYCFLNRIMGCISVAYILYLGSKNILLFDDVIAMLMGVSIALLFGFLKIWGEGDSEIFIVISPFIATYGTQYIIVNFIIAMSLSAIFNLIAITIKKLNLESQVAFAPYIAISSLLILTI